MDTDNRIFNSEFALSQFNGCKAPLITILDKFKSQYFDFDNKLVELLEREDLSGLKRDIHTLKGVSGNLGMNALHLASKEIEPLLSIPMNQVELRKYLDLVKTTLNAVEDYISTPTNIQPPGSVQGNDKELLLVALKRNEFISDKKLQDFMQKIEMPQQTKATILDAIENLDYTAAITLLS